MCLINLAAFCALFTRLEFSMTLLSESGFLQTMQRYWPLNMSVIVICCALFRLYSSLWEFAGPKELFRLCLASALGVAISYVGMRVMKLPIPRSFVVLNTRWCPSSMSPLMIWQPKRNRSLQLYNREEERSAPPFLVKGKLYLALWEKE